MLNIFDTLHFNLLVSYLLLNIVTTCTPAPVLQIELEVL